MHGTKWSRVAVAAAVLGLTLGIAGKASAGPDDRKLDRQIRLFETIVDDMLVESPNWLVQGRHDTRGRYRDGKGARFTFDASLVNQGWSGGKWWKFWRDGHDDGVVIIDMDDLEDLDKDEIDSLVRSEKRSGERRKARAIERGERLYERGKAELFDTMISFAEILPSVPDSETLEVVAYLDDCDYFYEKDLRTLTVTAKMSDLRAFAAGRIDEEAMIKRLTIDES